MFIFSTSNVVEKINKAKEKAKEFERHPPVWAVIVAGVAIYVLMQAMRHL